MSDIICPRPECNELAIKVQVFDDEWIQCEKGHKTIVNETKLSSRGLNGTVLEESIR